MSVAERIARQEDLMAGRVIPAWKYDLTYVLVLVGEIAGRVLPDGYWWSLLSGALVVAPITFLLRPYRRRRVA